MKKRFNFVQDENIATVSTKKSRRVKVQTIKLQIAFVIKQ